MKSILLHTVWAFASVQQTAAATRQKPLLSAEGSTVDTNDIDVESKGRRLHGRFLHITDIHPDPFYTVYSSTEENAACHRGDGPAGFYGAETSDCDSPLSLVNATFKWIQENLKDKIDFVVWTGDSARHDNDENLPRSEEQVLRSNTMLVSKMKEVFGTTKHDSPRIGAFQIPIVPTFGNNDILPHNILTKGPNRWTRQYLRVWRDIIPEEQRHGFERGGWFYVEVIPNQLAVFSLNTMYFFESNSAVDGCAARREPGYQHMEWLRIQLSFLRRRGMKAIIMGHVPPARTSEKSQWDETCWQKYTLWMQQYRDVVVGSIYGHMNVEHFLLQDFHDIDLDVAAGINTIGGAKAIDDPVKIKWSTTDYLVALRKQWADLPSLPSSLRPGSPKHMNGSKSEKDRQAEKERYFGKIGGSYAERFSVSQVSASVVPNYFPTLRVYEYNITGLEHLRFSGSWASTPAPETEDFLDSLDVDDDGTSNIHDLRTRTMLVKPHFTVPRPPSKGAPPGPAYSPQTFSLTGYEQYFSNLTYINNDFTSNSTSLFTLGRDDASNNDKHDAIHGLRWRTGKHHHKQPNHPQPKPRNFTYEVEYDTRSKNDSYGLRSGLTMMNWLELAATIGEYKPGESEEDVDMDKSRQFESDPELDADLASNSDDEVLDEDGDEETIEDEDKKKKKKHGKKKHGSKKKRREHAERTWLAFASRGLIGTMTVAELKEKFG